MITAMVMRHMTIGSISFLSFCLVKKVQVDNNTGFGDSPLYFILQNRKRKMMSGFCLVLFGMLALTSGANNFESQQKNRHDSQTFLSPADFAFGDCIMREGFELVVNRDGQVSWD